MTDLSADKELMQLYDDFQKTRQAIVERLRSHGSTIDRSYEFVDASNKAVALESFFGDQADLLVIHNMGKSCQHCTLWADGLNGILPHLLSRTAVVLVNPDTPQTQQEFAASRDWTFRMVSDASGEFTKDMHFSTEQDGKRYVLPGVSAFHRAEDGTISHVASDYFGPGDMYMPAFPLFELLHDESQQWEPQYAYQKPLTIDVSNAQG